MMAKEISPAPICYFIPTTSAYASTSASFSACASCLAMIRHRCSIASSNGAMRYSVREPNTSHSSALIIASGTTSPRPSVFLYARLQMLKNLFAALHPSHALRVYRISQTKEQYTLLEAHEWYQCSHQPHCHSWQASI